MLALLLTLVLPGTAFADKRDKGQGRDRDRRDRKCGKFVNCHDARDGRWDGKGPRRDWDNRSGRRHNRIHNRLDRRHDRYHDRVGDQDNRRHTRFHRRLRREHSQFHNRTNRRVNVREVNRTNTMPFRRSRG